jgi:hypothetical protein
MHTIDLSKCKQCDGDLPIAIKVINGIEIKSYQSCLFCSKVDEAVKIHEIEELTRMQLSSVLTPEVIKQLERPVPVEIAAPEREKYCDDFIAAISIIGHLLQNNLVDQNKLRELIRVDNTKLTDDEIKVKIAQCQASWVYLRTVESEHYQYLQKRSKKFLETDPNQKSYTKLISPDKEKEKTPSKLSKQNYITLAETRNQSS